MGVLTLCAACGDGANTPSANQSEPSFACGDDERAEPGETGDEAEPGETGDEAEPGEAGEQPDAGGPSETGGAACTRDSLKAAVDQYFEALAAHDPSSLPLASGVKYTENGAIVEVGAGAWQTAGALKFKRLVVDTESCNVVAEAVIENETTGGSAGGGDILSGILGGIFGGSEGSESTEGSESSASGTTTDFVYGLRLKLVNQEIAEIETILVGPDGWFPAPDAVIASGSDDWETELPAGEQPTRDELKQIVDDYFALFSTGSVSDFPFTNECVRMENGFSPGACDFGIPTGLGAGMEPRLYVLDVEAGIGLGFVMFAGAMTDFHMFKLRNGEVHGVHAVLATASGGSGWD